MGFDMLVSTTGLYLLKFHMSLLPEGREGTSFGRGGGADSNLFQKFLKRARFDLITRNPSTIHLELISICMDCLRPNGLLVTLSDEYKNAVIPFKLF